MLDDQTLRMAAEAAGMAMLRTYDGQSGEPHVFSARFTKKMNKLVRRTKHPTVYRVLRSAAAIVLIIAALFGTLLVVSPEARAKVFGWIHEMAGIYHHYAPSETTPDNTDVDYYLPAVPDGYTLVEESEIGSGKVYIYFSPTNLLQFEYLLSANNELFINPEGEYKEEVTIGSVVGTLYIADDDSKNNQIVWLSEDESVLFTISANLEKDELVALAESVKSK